jgi:hypothetical protein
VVRTKGVCWSQTLINAKCKILEALDSDGGCSSFPDVTIYKGKILLVTKIVQDLRKQ